MCKRQQNFTRSYLYLKNHHKLILKFSNITTEAFEILKAVKNWLKLQVGTSRQHVVYIAEYANSYTLKLPLFKIGQL